MPDPSPALVSTSTRCPALVSAFTPAGTSPTRYSLSFTSLGRPTIIVFSWWSVAGGRWPAETRHSTVPNRPPATDHRPPAVFSFLSYLFARAEACPSSQRKRLSTLRKYPTPVCRLPDDRC